MAASPQWKVYNPEGEYIASTKHLEDAGCLVAFNGDGSTIRWNHGPALWTEGAEDQPAAESYDHDFTHASDGFCSQCPAARGVVTFRNEGRIIDYVAQAVIERLNRDGVIPDLSTIPWFTPPQTEASSMQKRPATE